MLPDAYLADTDDGGDNVPEKALWHQGKGRELDRHAMAGQ